MSTEEPKQQDPNEIGHVVVHDWRADSIKAGRVNELPQSEQIENLTRAVNYYRSGMCHVRPDFVPARVRLPREVRGDCIFDNTPSKLVAPPGDYDCTSNYWGAISVIVADGKRLGIKPAEFEVLGWRKNE